MRNVLERAAQIALSPVLTAQDLELQYSAIPSGNSQGKGNAHHTPSGNHFTLREMETHYIEAVLREEEGSIDRAARRLGISRSSLYNKVRSKEVDRRVGGGSATRQLCFR
jgi:DNA-binding NtrC family response regulator